MRATTHLVTGAAGFIGSHLTDRLLARGARVVAVDNLRLGREQHLTSALRSEDCIFIRADVNAYDGWVRQLESLGINKIDEVWHLAANSDIRAGSEGPDVDLQHTFMSTVNVLRLAREFRIRRLAFASSSAIYGPHPGPVAEDTGPFWPISNYGAMKLASEAAISAGLELHLEQAWIFRFPNVVGSRATHGVIHDLVRKLRHSPALLEVLGDGTQSKPYLHVSELVDALLFIRDHANARRNCFNIGPRATTTTVAYIAEAVIRAVSPGAAIRYTGGPRGWPGDVPRFEYSIERLLGLGWSPRMTSNEAVDQAVREIAATPAE